MSGILEDIIAIKKANLKKILSNRGELGSRITANVFKSSLTKAEGVAIIAETKKASPSRGIMIADYNASEIALEYEKGGASAVSVLTEEDFFGGSPSDLSDVKRACALPTLCKDFFIDPHQAAWAKSHGADAILLIVRALSDGQLQEILEAANEVSLASLVEVHSEAEFERAVNSGAEIIGVNNRDLDTLEVSLEVSERIAGMVSQVTRNGTITISESGIKERADIERLQKLGYEAFLIGESLGTADDRVAHLQGLLGK
ncbi:MAG: indole-3-glycerol phosphate synthase TrpC [candidate division Zixibacteria bacterium]|nr:indole-3-glycerol phosphate synthase TrpC [candidate division Zixibacteria bacterium]